MFFLLWYMFPRKVICPPCYLFEIFCLLVLKMAITGCQMGFGFGIKTSVKFTKPYPGTFSSSLTLSCIFGMNYHQCACAGVMWPANKMTKDVITRRRLGKAQAKQVIDIRREVSIVNFSSALKYCKNM